MALLRLHYFLSIDKRSEAICSNNRQTEPEKKDLNFFSVIVITLPFLNGFTAVNVELLTSCFV